VFFSDTEKDSNSGSGSSHIEPATSPEMLEIQGFDRGWRKKLSPYSLRESSKSVLLGELYDRAANKSATRVDREHRGCHLPVFVVYGLSS
jgi:hypothetical protein